MLYVQLYTCKIVHKNENDDDMRLLCSFCLQLQFGDCCRNEVATDRIEKFNVQPNRNREMINTEDDCGNVVAVGIPTENKRTSNTNTDEMTNRIKI